MTSTEEMGPIRRIVTTLDKEGVSHVSIDGPVRLTVAPDKIAAEFGIAWQTQTALADTQVEGDSAELPTGELTNPEGTVVRYVNIPPGGLSPMHLTISLDYGILLKGEVSLILDDGTTTPLSEGDLVVQRATNHAWHNTSKTKWARMIYVLVAAKPVMINGKPLDPISIVH
ncbi:hypothetical protein RQP46_010891 [Phenoliferia psychrophenolica]